MLSRWRKEAQKKRDKERKKKKNVERNAPIATIIFEFLSCASAQGEDSKETKG